MAETTEYMTTHTKGNSRRLVIRTSRRELSFSTITDDGQVIYEPYTLNSGISIAANLREALQQKPASLTPATTSTLIMVDTPVLMVPTPLYVPEDAATLYRHAYTGMEQQVVMATVLPDLDAVALFSVAKDLKQVADERLPDVHYTAALAPVWRHLHQRSYTGPRGKLYAYLHDRQMDVFSFGQGRFRFCTSFTVNASSDALYYLLSAWKQVGLTADHDELHLSGKMPDCAVLAGEARRFIKRVYEANPAGEFNRAAVTQVRDMPYDLMTLYVKGR